MNNAHLALIVYLEPVWNLENSLVRVQTSVCLILTAMMDFSATQSSAKLKEPKENNARKTQTAKMNLIALILYAISHSLCQV